MGFFKNLGKLAGSIIETPIAVAKDVVTLGGELTDREKSYSRSKLEELTDDIVDIVDDDDED